jgi:hypothetical protein
MFDPEPLSALPSDYVGRSCTTGFTVDGHSPEQPCGIVCSPGSLLERGAWVDAARELVHELQVGELGGRVGMLGKSVRVQQLFELVDGSPTLDDAVTAMQELRCIREDALALAPPPGPTPTPTPEPGGGGGFEWPTLPTLPSFTWPTLPSLIPDWLWWAAGGALLLLLLSRRQPQRRHEERAA